VGQLFIVSVYHYDTFIIGSQGGYHPYNGINLDITAASRGRADGIVATHLAMHHNEYFKGKVLKVKFYGCRRTPSSIANIQKTFENEKTLPPFLTPSGSGKSTVLPLLITTSEVRLVG
jgi:hypothetical protein